MFSRWNSSPTSTPATVAYPNNWSRSHLDSLSKNVVRKYDIRIIPLVFLAYTIFWLDRSNIALARVNGLEQDLGLQNTQFNASLAVFFAFYILLNIPANILLRKIGGGTFLPALMVAWGAATLCSGFVTNFAGLCVSRAAVGAAEAGFLGGVLLWLGFFYTNDEIVSRIGILLSSMPLSGSLGGLLAGGLSRIQTGSYSRWPWIFFIEGALTIVVGIIAYFVMPDTPATASFLTGEEKIAAKARMILLDHRSFARRIAFVPTSSSSNSNIPKSRRDSTHPEAARNDTVTTVRFSTTLDIPATIIGASSVDRIHKSTWKRAVLHPITLFMTVGCFFTVESIYAYNLFVPTLLVEMGFTGVKNPLMTVPPSLFAFLYTICITPYSQRSRRVALPLMVSACLATLGFLFLLIGSFAGGVDGQGKPVIVRPLQYAGTFLAGAGVSASTPLAMSWLCVNANPHYVRAISLGFVIGVGNFAAFLASYAYIKTSAPRYVEGHSLNIAFNACLLLVGAASLWWMRRENARRERGDRDHRLHNLPPGVSRTEHEMFLGWDHPRFRFHM
ncbi:unnamed protein product [Clonostachys solani]|uniref:Major facilitator superfamily (MFS) profile domain-containing protein n=1 Tax=Clonostachys solani TaxID=160281 RepID=A0A9N9YYZ0_9HYPO|nr:unnamed protein product [Clonostachys solani]